jgi:hypothetical protein
MRSCFILVPLETDQNKMSQITAAVKDAILGILLEKVGENKKRNVTIEPTEWQGTVNFNDMEAILQQFTVSSRPSPYFSKRCNTEIIG